MLLSFLLLDQPDASIIEPRSLIIFQLRSFCTILLLFNSPLASFFDINFKFSARLSFLSLFMCIISCSSVIHHRKCSATNLPTQNSFMIFSRCNHIFVKFFKYVVFNIVDHFVLYPYLFFISCSQLFTLPILLIAYSHSYHLISTHISPDKSSIVFFTHLGIINKQRN